MSDLILHEPLATEVRQAAQAEGLTVERVIEAAVRHYRTIARQRKIRAEAEWWMEAPAQLRAQYAGKYVAVHERQVVDHDPDENVLFDRVQQRFAGVAVLITPAEGRPVVWVRRPKVERL